MPRQLLGKLCGNGHRIIFKPFGSFGWNRAYKHIEKHRAKPVNIGICAGLQFFGIILLHCGKAGEKLRFKTAVGCAQPLYRVTRDTQLSVSADKHGVTGDSSVNYPDIVHSLESIYKRQEKRARLLPLKSTAVTLQKFRHGYCGEALRNGINRTVFFKNAENGDKRGQLRGAYFAVYIHKLH